MNRSCETCGAPAVTHVSDLIETPPELAPKRCVSCQGSGRVGAMGCIACGGNGQDGFEYRRWKEGPAHHHCEDHARPAQRVFLKEQST